MSTITQNHRAYPMKASYNYQRTPNYNQNWSHHQPSRWQHWPQKYPRKHSRGYYHQQAPYDYNPRWNFKEDILRKEDVQSKPCVEDLSTVASGNGSFSENKEMEGFKVKVHGHVVLENTEAAGPIFEEKYAACMKLTPPEPQEITCPKFL